MYHLCTSFLLGHELPCIQAAAYKTVKPHQYAPWRAISLKREDTNLSSNLFAAANPLLCLHTSHSESSPLKWKLRLLVWKSHRGKPCRRSKGDLSEAGKHCRWWVVTAQDLTAEQFAGLEMNGDVESLDQHSSLMLLVVTLTDWLSCQCRLLSWHERVERTQGPIIWS